MRKLLVAIVIALAAAAPASAATLRGVVVAHHGTRVAVAAANGRVTTIRTAQHLRVGARIVASAGRVRVVGRARRARIRGVVVRRFRGGFVISAGHSTFAIHHGRTLADANPTTTPAPGTEVETEVEIDDQGNLDEQETDDLGEASTVDVEGVLAADVAAGATSIVVLVDDGIPVVVQIPSSLALGAMTKGTEIQLTATVSGTTLTATKVESDGNDQGDDGGDGDND